MTIEIGGGLDARPHNLKIGSGNDVPIISEILVGKQRTSFPKRVFEEVKNMTENELTTMEERVKSWLKEAEMILEGDVDGYDGADGAGIVEELARGYLKLAIAYRAVKA